MGWAHMCLYKGLSVITLEHISDMTWATVSQFVLLSSDSQLSPPAEPGQGGGRVLWSCAKEMEEAVKRKRNSCQTPFCCGSRMWFTGSKTASGKTGKWVTVDCSVRVRNSPQLFTVTFYSCRLTQNIKQLQRQVMRAVGYLWDKVICLG